MRISSLSLVVLVLFLFTTPATNTTAATHVVQMVNLTFVPQNLTGVEVGDIVRWENTSILQHTTTSGSPCTANGTWNSGLMNPSATFQVTINQAGVIPYFCQIHCLSAMTGTITAEEPATGVTPSNPAFQLYQNHPNPFNPSTTITYSIDLPAEVEIDVYDVNGRFVSRVESTSRPAGTFSAEWNAVSHRGERVASGIYFYQLSLNGTAVEMRKMVLLK